MSQGVVFEYLVGLIAKQVDDHALVIWYNPEQQYRDLCSIRMANCRVKSWQNW